MEVAEKNRGDHRLTAVENETKQHFMWGKTKHAVL